METIVIRLDSTTIKIPYFGSWDIELSKCRKIAVTEPILEDGMFPLRETTNTTFMIPSQSLKKGIKSIKVNNESLLVEVSAKILNSNYFEGINQNTIEQVWDVIGSIPQVKLGKESINEATILKCDCTYTLKLEQPIPPILYALKLYPINDKYKNNLKKGESLEFNHKGTTKRERLILYDKKVELLSQEKDKQFVNSVLSKIEENKNLLRIETNLSKHRDMREILNIPSKQKFEGCSLLDVLQSKEHPTLKIYDKILTVNPELKFDFFNYKEIEYFKKLQPSAMIKIEGYKGVLDKCLWDISNVRTYLLDVLCYNKSVVSKLIKDFNLEIARHNHSQDSKSIFKVVNEIRELLKVA